MAPTQRPRHPALTWAEVTARRLGRQGLAVPRKDGDLPGVVAAMCGTHAQVMSAAELSVALRLTGATRTTVRDALRAEDGLVKTFGPRGTVHLLPLRDLPMWTGALSALPAQRSAFAPDVRMTPDQTAAVIEAIGASVTGTELTLDELSAAVVERAGPWAGDLVMPAFQQLWPRWRQALMTAAHRGAVCFGADRGRLVTYASPADRLPGFRLLPGDEALAELVTRYLHAYGPATPEHLTKWLATPGPWAAELFESLGERLERVDVDGTPAWVVAGDTAAPLDPPSGVRLLPYFDAYVVGSHPRTALFPGRAFDRATARGQAGNFPVLLVDGVVAGVWHQRRSGRRIAVTVEPLRRLPAARRRELEREVDRLAEILEGRAELTVGPVSVGPHA